jgi:hypothetical protein
MTEPGGKRRQHQLAGAGAEAALNQWGQIPSEAGVGAERCGDRGALAWVAHGLYVAGPRGNDPRRYVTPPRRPDRAAAAT